jgi:hypothetical protein
MTGVTCFDDLTRITGLDYEFMTLAQSDYDRRHGNSIVNVKSRTLYPDESIQNSLARELQVSGAVHGGEHRFVAPAGQPGIPRGALSHEFRGLDGTLAFTSARAVILRRSVAVQVPEESSAPDDGVLLGDQPLDPDDARQKVLVEPAPTIHEIPSAQDGISWLQHVLDTVESELSVRGRGGFDRLPVQWLPGADAQDTLHSSYDPQMWRSLPRSFEIQIDPIEKSKTFYVGESLVCLNPDGSVLIQDAHHSQILMGGGNIMLSCPHDIIMAPGRNLVGIAGNDCSVKSGRHVDLAANEGRVSIKAETQLGLLGGNGGQGGVLIESKATNEGLVVGTGTDQNVGGVLVKSATGLYCTASRVALDATDQDIVLRSNGAIIGLATQCELELTDGLFVFKDDQGAGGYAFTETECIVPGQLVVGDQVVALGGGFFDGSLIVSESIAAGGSVSGSAVGPASPGDKSVDNAARATRAAIQGAIQGLVKNLQSVAKGIGATLTAKLPLNRALGSLVGFSFATSEQLRTNAAGAFKLPETLWQAISRRARKGLTKPWAEKPVVSLSGDNRSTAPSPGYEAWSVQATYQLNEHDRYLDLETGLPIPHEDGSDALPPPTLTPLDKNYLIGNE